MNGVIYHYVKTELLKILRSTNDKTLIYAGTYREIDNLSEIMEDKFSDLSNVSLDDIDDVEIIFLSPPPSLNNLI
jgi:hypothetical protein